MIVLQNLTDSLEVKIGAAIFSGPVNVICSYNDSTLTRTIPFESSLTIGDVGSNTLVYPPILYHVRTVTYLSAVNTDSVDADVTFELSKSGVKSKLCKVTLAPGDKLEYTDGYGFKTVNADGEVKNSSTGGGGGGSVVSVNGQTGAVVLDATDIGLGNVPNVDATNPANIVQTSSYRFVTDAEKATYQTGYNNAAYASGGATTAITFNTSKYYGTATAPISSGSITYNFTNAVAGSKAIVFYNGSSEPTYPAGTYKQFGTYVASVLNILTFTYIDSNTVLLEITYSTVAGLQPEVTTWISKGGVATGFVLTALNNFVLNIASIRSKILRFNLLTGETFASAFIPIIVGPDSTTVLGALTDTNVNFTSSQWQTVGNFGGLFVNGGKYIDTGFNQSTISQFGQNDFGMGISFWGLTTANNVPMMGNTNYNINSWSSVPANPTWLIGSTSTSTVPLAGITGAKTIFIMTRTGVTTCASYVMGSKTSFTTTSTTKTNSNILVFTQNGTTIVTQTTITGASGGYFISTGLTDADETTLRGAWATFNTALGRG